MRTKSENNITFLMDKMLASALGLNPIINKDLREIYFSDQERYYNYYRNSYFYNADFFNAYSVEQVENLKIASAIVAEHNEERDSKHLKKLLHKGYKKAYNMVKTRGEIDVMELYAPYHSKLEKQEQVLEVELANLITACIHLGLMHDVEVKHLNMIGDFYSHYMHDKEMFSTSMLPILRQGVEESKFHIKKLRKEYLPHKQKEITLEDVVEFIVHPEHMEFIKQYGLNYPREEVFIKGKNAKYIGLVSRIFKHNGILEELTNSSILTQEDMDLACLNAYHAQTIGKIDEVYAPILIYTYLFVMALSREYKYTRERYLERSEEETFARLKDQEARLNREKEELRKEVDILKAQLENEKVKNENLSIICNSKDQEIKHLKAELEQREQHKKEITALRAYVYSNKEGYEETEDSLESIIEAINKKKTVIVGGHPRWVIKMKEWLPYVTYISPDSKNFDLKHLNACGTSIFINTATLGHSMYRKIMATVEKEKITINYLNGNYSKTRTVKEIHKQQNQ